MNETLDEQSRSTLVKYRMDRANETLAEADLLAKEGYYNATMNRLYYACFYAVLHSGIAASTHAGVRTMLGLHFVSKGLLANEYGKTFSRLFEIRHSGDYDDFVYCDKEMTNEYAPKAKAFVSFIKEMLERRP